VIDFRENGGELFQFHDIRILLEKLKNYNILKDAPAPRIFYFKILYILGYIRVHFFNPSNRTMALGSIQPLTEMSTRNLPGG
jgi:hypothetical protein